MAMGTRKQRERQEPLWYQSDLPEAPGHPFYQRLNRVLDEEGFDRFCEGRCRRFYHEKLGRPSLAPGIYFRLMMIGFFEGLDDERAIAAAPGADTRGQARHTGREQVRGGAALTVLQPGRNTARVR